MVTLYNTYTRYTRAHYQEFIVIKFLQGLVVMAISQLLDLLTFFLPVTVFHLSLFINFTLFPRSGVGTATATTAMAVPLFRLTPWHIIALEQKTTVVLASLSTTSTVRRKMTGAWQRRGS